MAEVVDLEEWEVLSRNSSGKEEFEEEEDDGFIDFEYLSTDPEKRGELSDVGKLGKVDSGGVVGFVGGESLGGNLGELSRDFDSEMVVSSDRKGFGVGSDACTDKDCSDLMRGFDENGANYGKEDPTDEFVASVTSDEQESVGELGFREMEVLNEFYLNQVDDEVVNYEKSCLPRENNSEGVSEQFQSENLNDSTFPFQGIDNSDSVFATEPISEVVGWKSPKAILAEAGAVKHGFFEMQIGFQNKVPSGNCSNDRENHNISDDENKSNSTDAEVRGKVQDGAKGEKVLLSWLKVPIEVIKYYIFGVRPVWSISMAMGFLGFLMFSRSYYLYKKNQKDSKTRPAFKVRFDEKKRAAIQTRAARLNKAVGLVRQDPITRAPFPAFGVTLFPAMSSFQWAP